MKRHIAILAFGVIISGAVTLVQLAPQQSGSLTGSLTSNSAAVTTANGAALTTAGAKTITIAPSISGGNSESDD